LSTSVVMAGELRVPSGAPPGFVDHVHRYGFSTPHPPGRVWAWLNDPATFTEGQIWPFRVEFVDGGFEPGVLNAHHGPFLNLAGAIGEVQGFERGVAHRDLKYFYGSYAISPRLVRPGYSSGPKNRVAERWSSFSSTASCAAGSGGRGAARSAFSGAGSPGGGPRSSGTPPAGRNGKTPCAVNIVE
jgi:hypothetical protein